MTTSIIKPGFEFLHPRRGKVHVIEHIPTEYGTFSTFVRCSDGTDEFIEHENVVLAAVEGKALDEFFPVQKERVKAQGKTKLDKAAKYVEELLKDESLSNTKRISMLAEKLRLTKSAATTYFYKVRPK